MVVLRRLAMRKRIVSFVGLVMLFGVMAVQADPVNSLFNPFEYAKANLNSLTINGNVTINTDNGTITGWTPAVDSYHSESNQSGNVEMGVLRITVMYSAARSQ